MSDIKVKSDDQLTSILHKLDTYEEKNETTLNELREKNDLVQKAFDEARERLETLEDRAVNPNHRTYESVSKYDSDEKQTEGLRKWIVDRFRISEGMAPKHYSVEELAELRADSDQWGNNKGDETIPAPLAGAIERIVRSAGICRKLMTTVPMAADTLKLVNENVAVTVSDSANVVTEGSAPDTQAATFENNTITAKKAIALNEVSMELLEDTGSPLVQYLIDSFGEAFALWEDREFLLGNTGDGDSFTGVATAASELVNVGSTTKVDIMDGCTYENVVDLVYSKIDENLVGTAGTTLVFHPSLIGTLRKLRADSIEASDGAGGVLWTPMAGGSPNNVLGFPYVTSTVMPSVSTMTTVAATNEAMLYGDFKKAFIGQRHGYQVAFSDEAGFKSATRFMRVLERVGFVVPNAYTGAFARLVLTGA